MRETKKSEVNSRAQGNPCGAFFVSAPPPSALTPSWKHIDRTRMAGPEASQGAHMPKTIKKLKPAPKAKAKPDPKKAAKAKRKAA